MLDALNDLKERGFTLDFNLANGVLHNSNQEVTLSPDDFEICEFYRFEGMSQPDDMSIVYAIKSDKYNVKGVFVNAYGTYADDTSEALLKKLDTHKVILNKGSQED